MPACTTRPAALSSSLREWAGNNTDGDRQGRIDIDAHDAFVAALAGSPVAALASEEVEGILPLTPGAPCCWRSIRSTVRPTWRSTGRWG